jgi:hypothetical protein
MKDNTKKYLKVSITLASICSVSALLIGLVNYLTADTIKANEEAAVWEGLRNVYPTADKFGDKVAVSDKTYVVSYWVASQNEKEIGYVFRASGTNSYGSITILVGIAGTGSFGTIYLVSSTETKNDFVAGYLTPYNEGTSKDTDIDSVKCGATYAATLIKNMAYEAQSIYKSEKGAK